MKYLILIPVMLLPACATKKPVIVHMQHEVPGTIIPAEDMESIRYGENLKGYTVGRYIEPNDSLVMHERHTVYRVETTAKWNLHPNPAVAVPMGPVGRIVDPAHREPPVNAEIISEVNRQKAITQAIMAQDQKMGRALDQLSTVVKVNQQMAQENMQLQQEMTTTAKRMDALESQLREQPTISGTSSETNGW
jgi:hypothetical protein